MKTGSTARDTLRIYWQYTRRYRTEFLLGGGFMNDDTEE
jgi:hypothetical protein